MEGVTIQGCGVAGVCLGWQLWWRGVPFRHEGQRRVGASWAAAGLVNPVTGKGMSVGWRLDDFLGEMAAFYAEVEKTLGKTYFHRLPVLRVFTDKKEIAKFQKKQPAMSQWVGTIYESLPDVKDGSWGGVEWVGGGWVDVRGFLDDSLAFFEKERRSAESFSPQVFCEGTLGLSEGVFSFLPTRLAKGEILEVVVPGWDERRILNRRGWCIPLGGELYRVGATYEWDDLTNDPTPQGREKLEKLVREFTDRDFVVRNHVAGVRPIVRNSEPVVGSHPTQEGQYVLNGLGSKGCLYGPGAARQLVEFMLDGKAIDSSLSLRLEWGESEGQG